MTSKPHALDALVAFLRQTRGVDFSGYKRASLGRRFEKRMTEVGVGDHASYLAYLQRHPEEIPLLFNTILINVTSFFRDPETWSALQNEILSPALSQRRDEPLRAWSAGCASGEEPYTIAIMLAELLGEDEAVRRVKIYATDLDEEALRHARQGVYPAASMEAIPTGLVDKYFSRASGGFELRKALRRCVIFGRNDLILDPPISRLDLIVCRNTLMYMDAETQARVLARFCFALNEQGVLLLGKAEMVLTQTTMFAPLDLKRHLFSPIKSASLMAAPRSRPRPVPPENEDGHVLGLAYDAGANAQLVVDAQGALLLANRKAREAFSLGARDLGRPFQDLAISYRPVNLRALIDQVNVGERVAELKKVERALPVPGFVDVQVEPLRSRTKIVAVQITFIDVSESSQLEQELKHANREVETAYSELQSAGEELETTNEELQSTNEELETTNEELQSTNEELETTNQELQSTNDELGSVNDALGQRSAELEKLSGFLGAILSTLEAAVIVVDVRLRVEIWNKRAEDLWGLRNDEVRGKNLTSLDIGLPTEALVGAIHTSFMNGERKEIVVDGMNRRGKGIRCSVTCTRLDGSDETRGSVLVISVLDGEPRASRSPNV